MSRRELRTTHLLNKVWKAVQAVPSAIKFNKDEFFTRCILCKTFGDIYSTDVIYHKNCVTNYITKFQRDVSDILDD